MRVHCQCTGTAVSPTAGSATLYVSDSSPVDLQKYRQMCVAVAGGGGPSSSAAGSSGAMAAVKPHTTGIITPNIHQPPPALPPPYPPPVQVCRTCYLHVPLLIQ